MGIKTKQSGRGWIYVRLCEQKSRNDSGTGIALGLFNLSERVCRAQLNTEELGLPLTTGKTLVMKNLETGETLQPRNGAVGRDISPYGCEVYRCRIADL